MFIRNTEEEEPLIQPPQQTFVRQGAFRVSTRRPNRSTLSANRHKVAAENATKNAKNDDNSSNAKSNADRFSEGSSIFYHPSLSGDDRVNYLPPLPPQKHHDESLQKLPNDASRKSLPSQSKTDHTLRGSTSHSFSSPPPPSSAVNTQQRQDLPKRSHSFNQGSPHGSNNELSGQLSQEAQISGDIHKTWDQRHSRETWNQRLLAALRRPPSPSLQKRTSASSDTGKPIHQHNTTDAKKNYPTIFKRPTSPSLFYRSVSCVEDGSSHDSTKSMNAGNAMTIQGRSSPPIRSLTPQMSPVTYRRDPNSTDPPSSSSFRRYGSFPLNRKQGYHPNSVTANQSRDKELSTDAKRIMGYATFRRPSTPPKAMSACIDAEPEVKCTSKGSIIFQRENTNCFALLPSSRPDHLNENKTHDPETVSLPIQRETDPNEKYQKVQDMINTAAVLVSKVDREARKSKKSGSVRLQRTHSLPATKREMVSNLNRSGFSKDSENAKDRSQSLNTQFQRMDKFTSSLQHGQIKKFGEQITSTRMSHPQEQPEPRLIRSTGSVKSQDSFMSHLSDNLTVYVKCHPQHSPEEDCQSIMEDVSGNSSPCSSIYSQDMYESFDSNSENYSKHNQSNAAHISYMLTNDAEYISCLARMLDIYEDMCIETPPHIRQHFDVLFKHIGLLQQFHILLHAAIKDAGTNLTTIADAFMDEQFQCYSPYMVMTPTVQKDFLRYSIYFDEHFPSLKRDFLKPSVRINFYAMVLDSLKKSASEYEKLRLQSAVDYLNNLKQQANTEMTITAVTNSPVDLRLCGNMLMIGDLFCHGAGPLQKRKYHMILFENILMIVSSKQSSFKYKIHYRIEQLETVKSAEEDPCEFSLKVLTEGQVSSVNFKFRAKLQTQRNQWVSEIQKIVSQTKSQYTEKIKNTISICDKSYLLPLSLYKTYPQLILTLSGANIDKKGKSSSPESLSHLLITHERGYIRQISSLLNPEILEPPDSICTLLEKIYHLHKKKILPELERNQHRGVNYLLGCIFEHLHLFHIYSEYFVVRCQLNAKLERGTEATLYISPIQHFTGYMSWLRQVSYHPAFQNKAKMALQRLKDLVLDAQVRLLSESIVNGRIDFYRSGNLLRNDTMEVKTKKRGVHEGIYKVLLFEKIIVLTKARTPFYVYVWDIWLNQVNLGPPSSSERGFKLEVRQGRGREAVTFEFRASSTVVQQIWIKVLQQELLHQAEDIRKRTSMYNI